MDEKHKKPVCDVCVDCRKIEAAVRLMEEDTEFALKQIASNEDTNAVKMLKRMQCPNKMLYFLKNDLEDWGLSVALSRNDVPHAMGDVVIQFDQIDESAPARIMCDGLSSDCDAKTLRQLFIALWDTPTNAPPGTIKSIVRAHLRQV